MCCAQPSWPAFTEFPHSASGNRANEHIYDFVQFVLELKFSGEGELGCCILPGYHNPIVRRSSFHKRIKGRWIDCDKTLSWIERAYPELALDAWRRLAVEWIQGEIRGVALKLTALSRFFQRYVTVYNLTDPLKFLSRSTQRQLPNFYATACPDSVAGIRYNNCVHDFLEFVLQRDEFSIAGDDGDRRAVSPAFCNPVEYRRRTGLPQRDESVHSPLPYGYIDELRQILASGPHFCDWQWAQSALGGGHLAPGWFEVSEKEINKDDPDCVWRERRMSTGETRLEAWSPVRWIALLVKLILPLRTFQVRMLDSGEADTWRFGSEGRARNTHRLASTNKRRPL